MSAKSVGRSKETAVSSDIRGYLIGICEVWEPGKLQMFVADTGNGDGAHISTLTKVIS